MNTINQNIMNNLAEKVDRKVQAAIEKRIQHSQNMDDVSLLIYRSGYKQKYGAYFLQSKMTGNYATWGTSGSTVVAP